ncbi:unnamed protein product [Candida verbasci]|uniref:Holocytochrome c-type synthase n=1 Tax=Candida verbasci TaxID=1227364 RepID=A0A9W4TYC9_9ASCO|nr:unnamed protein product [Candida verbasci]
MSNNNNIDKPTCPINIKQSWWSKLLWKHPAQSQPTPISACPVDHSLFSTPSQPVCPVDDETKSQWVKNIQIQIPDAIEQESLSCDSSVDHQPTSNVNLPVDRDISSIPRTSSNSNWIYPSQKQFYEAMKRKNWDPNQNDMKVVVPIHNLVNERAWKHIMFWEKPNLRNCPNITLTSFKGDSKKMTPRAWIKTNVFGYDPPFDRHDWKIDRCGVEVDYVIDFYNLKGSNDVWLDVRPKLNSYEGVKLRILNAIGI